MQPTKESKYNLAFLAGALLVSESLAVAKCFAETKNWPDTRMAVSAENLLRKTKVATGNRIYREVEQRLSTLTPDELEYLCDAGSRDAAAVILVGTCKRYEFIADFISEVLRTKVQMFDFVLRDSDYVRFWEESVMAAPEIENTSPKTQYKVRQILFKILTEAGLLQGDDGRMIAPLLPSQKVVELVVHDDWKLLRLFLFSEADMRIARERYGH